MMAKVGETHNETIEMTCCGSLACGKTKFAENVKLSNWRRGELDDFEEAGQYSQHLHSLSGNPNLLHTELLASAQHCQQRRMAAVCRYLMEGPVDLLENVVELEMASMKRGALHVAVTAGKLAMVKLLVHLDPGKLVMANYTDAKFKSATIVHLAVVCGQYEITQFLLSVLSQEERRNLIEKEAEGTAFYKTFKTGGLLLALAAWCGFQNIFFYLIEHGAQLDRKDRSTGNTALHAIVHYGILNQEKAKEFFDSVLESEIVKKWYAERLCIERSRFSAQEHKQMKNYLVKLTNNDGYGLLTYAGKYGVHSITTFLIQLEGVYRYTHCNFGPHSNMYYDMSEIDPVVTGLVQPQSPCLLDLLIYAGRDDDLPILAMEPIKTLTNIKWRIHRGTTILWMIFHIAVMIVMQITMETRIFATTTSQSLLKSLNEQDRANISNDDLEIECTIMNVLILDYGNFTSVDDETMENLMDSFYTWIFLGMVLVALSAVYIFLEFYEIGHSLYFYIRSRCCKPSVYKAPLKVIFKLEIFRLMSFSFSLLTLLWFILDLYCYPDAFTLFSTALVTGWYFVLYFTRPYRATGYFTVMVHRMLMGDFLRFAIIFGIVLLGFTSALDVAFSEHLRSPVKEFEFYSNSLLTVYTLIRGSDDIKIVGLSKGNAFIILLYIFVTVVGTVLLMNMLIAAMSDTYTSISSYSTIIWRKLRLGMILQLERRTLNCQLRRSMRQYLLYDKEHAIWVLPIREFHRITKQEPDVSYEEMDKSISRMTGVTFSIHL